MSSMAIDAYTLRSCSLSTLLLLSCSYLHLEVNTGQGESVGSLEKMNHDLQSLLPQHGASLPAYSGPGARPIMYLSVSAV